MLVVDASIAARWFVPALAWPSATEVLEDGESLLAPELILAEVANTFWKSVRSEYMTVEEMETALRLLPGFFIELRSLSDLVPEAGQLAVELDHPVYDCCYIALARREAAPLVTADKRLAHAAQASRIEVRLIG
jgi:predicted nucleic acid-binding protein